MHPSIRLAVVLLALVALGALYFVTGGGVPQLATPGPVTSVQAQQTTATLVNDTDWVLDHLYLSPAGSGNWGPDQLGAHALVKGQSLKLAGITCTPYDIKVVDDQGRDCIVRAADLCASSATYHLQAQALAGCTHE